MLLQPYTGSSRCQNLRSFIQYVLLPVPAVQTDASNDLQGVYLDDLMVSEQLFSLNVYVYDLQETEAGDITVRLV